MSGIVFNVSSNELSAQELTQDQYDVVQEALESRISEYNEIKNSAISKLQQLGFTVEEIKIIVGP